MELEADALVQRGELRLDRSERVEPCGEAGVKDALLAHRGAHRLGEALRPRLCR